MTVESWVASRVGKSSLMSFNSSGIWPSQFETRNRNWLSINQGNVETRNQNWLSINQRKIFGIKFQWNTRAS